MKEFRCKNGEVVLVEDYTENDTSIIVHYNGKQYPRSIDIIGKTLFSSVQLGQTVKIKNCSTHETLTVKICDVHTEMRYTRMGGAYYGNAVEVSYIGNDAGQQHNGIINVSVISPLGKALLNQFCGREITVPLPEGTSDKYKIISIES